MPHSSRAGKNEALRRWRWLRGENQPLLPYAYRLWAKVQKVGDCWEYTGAKTRKGYGLITWQGRLRPAHRVAWELVNGPIPEGMVLRHTCDNPPCIRPDHLIPGSAAENIGDMVSRGRQARGERVHTSRLTSAQVSVILRRLAIGERVVALSREFGVSHGLIGQIRDGAIWKAPAT